jgi:drug/metabolite transporter (DMT)-like permease
MFTLTDILVGFALPAVACAVILLLAWQPWRGQGRRDGRWAGAIAIGVAYAIAYIRLVGDLRFPPASPDNWIIYLLPVVMLLGVLFCMLPPAPLLRLAGVLAVSVALAWLLLKPLIGVDTPPLGAGLQIAAASIAMTAWWLLLNELARRGPRLTAPAIVVLVAAGGSLVLGENGLAIRGGLPLAALAAIALAATVVAALTHGFKLAGGGTLAVSLILFGTFLYAYFYLPEPTPRMLAAMPLLVSSPALAWLAWLPRVRHRPAWQRGLLALAAVLLAIAAAVVLVEWRGQTTSPESIDL